MRIVCVMAIVLSLAACGGGGGGGASSGVPALQSAVSGVAASGNGISGRVYIKDVTGQERFVDTTTGSFTLMVSGLTPPYLLKAQWTAGGGTQTLYSFATAAGTVDITPLTALAVTAAAGGLSLDAVYAAPTAGAFNAIAAALPAAVAQLRSALGPLLAQYAVSNFNLMNGAFAADHTGMDALLDSITVTIAGGQSTVTDTASGTTLLDAPSADLAHAVTMPAWTAQDAAAASDPDIAVDAAGNALVVWADPVSYAIRARFVTDPAATTLTLSISGLSISPRVAVDAAGDAVVTWAQTDNGRNNIWVRQYTAASQTWGAAVQVSVQNAAADALPPDVAVDAAGNAIVLWSQGNGQVNDFDEWYATWTAGGGVWSAPALASDGVNSAYGGRIAVNATGQGIAVWQQEQGNGSVSNAPTDVWARTLSTGGAWNAAARINAIAGTQLHVYGQIAVAMDSAGNGLALWAQGPVQAAMLAAGSGWQASQTIMSTPANLAYGPRVAFDAGGNAVAVWQEQDGVSAFGGTNRYTAAGGWGTSSVFSTPAPGFVYLPRVAVDGAGNATAVWYQVVTGVPPAQVYTNRYIAAGGWGTPRLFSPTTTDGFSTWPVPVVGANAAGQTVAVWGIDSL